MADNLLQSEGVFEITDHTTASDWERFIAHLEEVLTEWELQNQSDRISPYKELPAGAISKGLWHERKEVLKLENTSFELRYQYLQEVNKEPVNNNDKPKPEAAFEESGQVSDSDLEFEDAEDGRESETKEDLLEQAIPLVEEKEHGEHEVPGDMPECVQDLIATSNDFASRAHCLVRWYNLRRFIILTPRGDTIVSEDKVKFILSSASIALSNTDCHIPIFVQIHNPKNHFYQGVSEHRNVRTMYETIYYRKNLKQYSYLSELISLFREKTSSSLSDPISATVRLNYCLDYFDLFVSKKDEFAGNEFIDDEDHSNKPRKPSRPIAQDMRSGATFEQVLEALEDCIPHPYKIMKFLHVAAIWPPVSDKVITDTQVHSDLDPAEAPIWTLRCVTSDNCNMKIVHETQAISELFKSALTYAYDQLDANVVFGENGRANLERQCLEVAYKLSTQPEVILSEQPTDNMRKLIALLFHRAEELTAELDPMDQLAAQLKKKPSLSEIYRSFVRKHKPSVREFIIRTQISRPFNPISTPALPQRMFSTICDEEFRLCGAFTELCN